MESQFTIEVGHFHVHGGKNGQLQKALQVVNRSRYEKR